MQFLSIGVSECVDDVVQQISKELKELKNKNINYTIDEVNSGDSTSIICSIDVDKPYDNKSRQYFDAVRIHVCNALADFIILKYEDKLINRVINTNYCYFNSLEKKEISSIAQRTIKNEDKNLVSSLFRIHRRNVIVRKLLDYFEGANDIILDGFVNFRLKDYVNDLEEIVDKAVDDYLMEREYKEFIRLLRYFVDIQEPRYDVIHVMYETKSDKYILMDEDKNEVASEYIQDFSIEEGEGEINQADLLVSSLISLAPKKIIIHGNGHFKNKELLETIKNVFSGKVVLCSHCEICGYTLH